MSDDTKKEPSEADSFSKAVYWEAVKNLSSSIAKSHQIQKDAAESWIHQLDADIIDKYYSSKKESALDQVVWGSQTSNKLKAEIAELEKKARKQADEISKHTVDKEKAAKELDKLRTIVEELYSKQGIQHLLRTC